MCNDKRVTTTTIVTAIVTLTEEKAISAQPSYIFTLQGQKEQEQLQIPTAVYVYTPTLTTPPGQLGPQVSVARGSTPRSVPAPRHRSGLSCPRSAWFCTRQEMEMPL